MKEIVIVRHGQTLFNLLNRTQGWSDTPLTEQGRQQARDLGMALRASDLWIDILISSDRGRAVETARIIRETAGLDLDIIEQAGWREMSFGSLEGLDNKENTDAISRLAGFASSEEAYQSRGQFRQLITDYVYRLDQSGWAESGEELKERLLSSLDQVVQQMEEEDLQRALVVAHGVVMETLFLLLEPGQDLPEIENGKAMILQADHGQIWVKAVNLADF